MKVKFKVEDIIEPLAKLAKIIPKNPTDGFSLNIMISANDGLADFIGVNRRIQKKISVPYSGDPCEFAIRFDKLNNLVKTLPKDKDISIKVEAAGAVITCGRSRVKSPVFDASGMPIIYPDNLSEISVSPQELSEKIKTVSFASAKDDVMAALNGVYVSPEEGGISVVATDKKIIAVNKVSTKDEVSFRGFIIPISLIPLACEDLNDATKILSCHTHIEIKGDDFETYLPLVDAKYPNFKSVLPDDRFPVRHSLTFNKEKMVECLNRVSVIADDPKRSRCRINAPIGESDAMIHGWFIIGDSSEINDSIPMINESEYEMSIAYSPDFLLSGLNKIKSETINCNIYDNQVSPLVLQEDDFVCVISQIKI